MELNQNKYLFLIALHILIGAAVNYIKFLSDVYFASIFLISLYYIIKSKNKNNEVLYVSAYIVGSEIFLRMTDGSPSYEFGKYAVIFFSVLGMYYSGISKKATVYWIYLMLLIPGLIFGILMFEDESFLRKTIVFNISGPICLGINALYCYGRRFTIDEISNLLVCIGLPIITCATYLFFYTPNVREALNGTGSNGTLSGGFGPNQVATILGLGIFIFVFKSIFNYKSKFLILVNVSIALYLTYRGFLTFSRGGMVTAFVMIASSLGYVFFVSTSKLKLKLSILISFMLVFFGLIWMFTSYQTDGLIDKRYANKDQRGRQKEDVSTGRTELAKIEIDLFLDNPVFGIGVGMGQKARAQKLGFEINSHNEITRILSEHGSLGIIILLILMITPIVILFRNFNHIFLIPFYLFWLLSINHAAMRTASPAFIYGLTLLVVRKNKD